MKVTGGHHCDVLKSPFLFCFSLMTVGRYLSSLTYVLAIFEVENNIILHILDAW